MLILAFCWFKQAVALVSFSRVSSTCCFGPLFRKTTWLVRVSPMALVWKHVIYLEAAGWRHRGSSPLQSLSSLLRDVTALARSWTSSDGWFQGERPADRRALEGAVAKSRKS